MKYRSDRGSEFWNVVVSLLLVLVFAVLMAVIAIEWVAGCGESYVDSKGQRHLYECVYLNNKE